MTDLATSTCVDQRACRRGLRRRRMPLHARRTPEVRRTARRQSGRSVGTTSVGSVRGRSRSRTEHRWTQASSAKRSPRRNGPSHPASSGILAVVVPADIDPGTDTHCARYEIDAATGERVAVLLRWALFEHGFDIADPFRRLEEIAARHGISDVTPSESLCAAEHRRGVARGVVGSPHFFTAHGDYFSPGLDVSHDPGGRVRLAPSGARFDNFMDAALA